MDFYMRTEAGAPIGMPMARPSRVDAEIGGTIYRNTDCTAWSDEDLAKWAGLLKVDPGSKFDPEIHDATDGGSLSKAGLALPAYEVRILTKDDVRAEARRRLFALTGARDQGHLSTIISDAGREAMRLIRKEGQGAITADEQDRLDHLQSIDDQIQVILDASSDLKALEQIPEDYRDDKHWA